jgi:hypothetical protein
MRGAAQISKEIARLRLSIDVLHIATVCVTGEISAICITTNDSLGFALSLVSSD